MTPHNFQWTEAKLDELRQHLKAGLSASESAAKLGTTRTSVIGKATRNGWRFGQAAGQPASEPRPRVVWTPELDATIRAGAMAGKTTVELGAELGIPQGSVSSRAVSMGISFARGRPPKPVPLAAMSWGAKASEKPVQPALLPKPRAYDVARSSLADLKGHQCKWPVGDPQDAGFGFCALDREDARPYCAHHNKRSQQVNTGRKSVTFHGSATDLARALRRVA